MENKKDTTYIYTYQRVLSRKLGLRQVLLDTCNHHFRLWTGTRVVDVCKNGDGVMATLIRWAQEITPGNEPETHRVFKQLISLDTLAMRIERLIEDSKIKEIPDQSDIKGWDQGLDGTTYMIEYLDDSVYYFKSYWTPSAQEHIKEGVMVEKFIDSMMATVETPEARKQFASSIPFQCWTNGGISMGCKVLTRKQARKYKRERNHYRRSINRQKSN